MLGKPQVFKSSIDQSVNFVWDLGDKRLVEARFVQRDPSYFIVYLSSQTGCTQACRFCHLTATRQTSFDQMGVLEFMEQAQAVISYYRERVDAGMVPATKVHFNWMARGEPLLNPHILQCHHELFATLRKLVPELEVRFNISSIFPKGCLPALDSLLDAPGVRIYYSLYSLEGSFRRRWLPKAEDPWKVLTRLAQAQEASGLPVILHWALIEGQNDSEKQAQDIVNAVNAVGLNAKFNLVRYNPWSERQGRESPEPVVQKVFTVMHKGLQSSTSRIVPRVGFDVAASCGMFLTANDLETENE